MLDSGVAEVIDEAVQQADAALQAVLDEWWAKEGEV